MSCDDETGALLAGLAAKRLGGRILELGTGFGVGTAWLRDGMDARSSLVTVESDPDLTAVARQLLSDRRVTFVTADAGEWLTSYVGRKFDLIFADTWPGKFTFLDAALDLVALGGTYVVDDLTPLEGWPTRHRAAVEDLVTGLMSRPDFRTEVSPRSTGLLLATRVADPPVPGGNRPA